MNALVEGPETLKRLRALAAGKNVLPQQLLTRFALERFLYRLSIWERRENMRRPLGEQQRPEFILKGAWCFVAWHGDMYRPTRDLDLHRVGDATEPTLAHIVRSVCAMPGADDVAFDAKAIDAAPILQGHHYGGWRLKVRGRLGRKTQLTVSLDIVPGDDVFNPQPLRLVTLVPPLPEPVISVYSRESVIAEKLHAIAVTGMLNSRMKDYLDLYQLSMDVGGFLASSLSAAVRRTFTRRRSYPPKPDLLGLSDDFIAHAQTRWTHKGLSLRQVVERVRAFVIPILHHHSSGTPLPRIWSPTDGWRQP